MHRLFVYGTLRQPDLLARLLGRVPSTVAALLAGHRAAPLAGRVYPGLVVDDEATADGSLIEVTTDELRVLDEFEGPEYERVPVVVRAEEHEVSCEAWLLVGSSAERVEQGSWSFERYLSEGAADFLGRSEAGAPHPGSRR